MPTIDTINSLLLRYLQRDLRNEDLEEVEALFERYPGLRQMVEELDDPEHLSQLLAEYSFFKENIAQPSKARVMAIISKRISVKELHKRNNVFKRNLLFAVAACLLPVLLFCFWLLREKFESSHATDIAMEQAKGITGGLNAAFLVSEDGRQLVLDQNLDGIIIDQSVRYADGSIVLGSDVDNLKMTLVTPRGGKYSIVLSDGTKVWLNADTKLKYPLKFMEKSREVELEGEAYFEVTSDPSKPFIVRTSKESVQVVGTNFNVHSYGDEGVSKVSLLEGKVKVSVDEEKQVILSPGQQSVLKGQSVEVNVFNTDEVLAWKNGEFVFNNEGLGDIVKSISRWYAVDIEIDPSLNNMKLWGSISRLDNFSKVLEIIKMTDDNIKIKIEERRVKIML